MFVVKGFYRDETYPPMITVPCIHLQNRILFKKENHASTMILWAKSTMINGN